MRDVAAALAAHDTNAHRFVLTLIKLGVPVWMAQRGNNGAEFHSHFGWQKLSAEGNYERITSFSPGMAPGANTGGKVAVVDVDPRNGGDIENVRALLDELGVRIYAEIATPGDGRHFYVAGHHEVPNVHSTAKNNRPPGYPGWTSMRSAPNGQSIRARAVWTHSGGFAAQEKASPRRVVLMAPDEMRAAVPEETATNTTSTAPDEDIGKGRFTGGDGAG